MAKRTNRSRALVEALADIARLEKRIRSLKEILAERDSEVCALRDADARRGKEMLELRANFDDAARQIEQWHRNDVEERHRRRLSGDRNADLEVRLERAHTALADLLLRERDAAADALAVQRTTQVEHERRVVRGEILNGAACAPEEPRS